MEYRATAEEKRTMAVRNFLQNMIMCGEIRPRLEARMFYHTARTMREKVPCDIGEILLSAFSGAFAERLNRGEIIAFSVSGEGVYDVSPVSLLCAASICAAKAESFVHADIKNGCVAIKFRVSKDTERTKKLIKSTGCSVLSYGDNHTAVYTLGKQHFVAVPRMSIRRDMLAFIRTLI